MAAVRFTRARWSTGPAPGPRRGCEPVVTRAPSEPFGSTLSLVNRRSGRQKRGRSR